MQSTLWQKLLVLFILLASLSACAKPDPTLVVTVGGLGFSQMGDLRKAIERQCPHAKVVSAGAWDAYKNNNDILKIATAKPRQHIVFIGHSFGCLTIDQAAAQLPKVDLAVFIDPAWNDIPLAHTIKNYLWYKRSNFGLEREAKIVGATSAKTIQGDHNSIPHSPQLISELVLAINSMKITPEPDRHHKSTSSRPIASNAGGSDPSP